VKEQYSFTEFDQSQLIILSIKLIYDDITDFDKKLIVINQRGSESISRLSLNTLFGFQTQFKDLRNEHGAVKFLIVQRDDRILLNSDKQLKPYFKELINEIKEV